MINQQRAFPIVITGHVDHGKSTLIGRLLYDTGTLQSDRYQEMVQSSGEVGREDEFAFVLDAFEEERRRGITIDTSQIYFTSKRRPYVIIDAPGHREFIRNMITGASYATAAVLLLDAGEGVMEQTRRHAWLLNTVGIRDVCVAVNKMDAVGYDAKRFFQLKAEVETLFSGGAPIAVIPISARTGANVVAASNAMAWYQGPSLLEVLDRLEEPSIEERSFRFPVQDVYDFDGKPVVVGRVESGSITAGAPVRLYPSGEEAVIKAIRSYASSERDTACYGEAIGFRLSSTLAVTRGTILAAGEPPRCGRQIDATIFWFLGEFSSGGKVTVRCATQAVTGIIELREVFDPAQPETELAPDLICIGEAAHCTVTTDSDLVSDLPQAIPEMGRFVIEIDGIPAGAGIFR